MLTTISSEIPLSPHLMNSEELAQYIERTDGMGKSWLLVQLRLKKLEEQKPDLSIEEYTSRLDDIYQDLMNLGEWWLGIESEVFSIDLNS